MLLVCSRSFSNGLSFNISLGSRGIKIVVRLSTQVHIFIFYFYPKIFCCIKYHRRAVHIYPALRFSFFFFCSTETVPIVFSGVGFVSGGISCDARCLPERRKISCNFFFFSFFFSMHSVHSQSAKFFHSLCHAQANREGTGYK